MASPGFRIGTFILWRHAFMTRLFVPQWDCSRLLLCLSPWLSAQIESGSINGQVTDPQHAADRRGGCDRYQRPEPARRSAAKTNGDGSFAFPTLRPSHYKITVQKEGFKIVGEPGHGSARAGPAGGELHSGSRFVVGDGHGEREQWPRTSKSPRRWPLLWTASSSKTCRSMGAASRR